MLAGVGSGCQSRFGPACGRCSGLPRDARSRTARPVQGAALSSTCVIEQQLAGGKIRLAVPNVVAARSAIDFVRPQQAWPNPAVDASCNWLVDELERSLKINRETGLPVLVELRRVLVVQRAARALPGCHAPPQISEYGRRPRAAGRRSSWAIPPAYATRLQREYSAWTADFW